MKHLKQIAVFGVTLFSLVACQKEKNNLSLSKDGTSEELSLNTNHRNDDEEEGGR
ncbi:hypothetical protein [Ferruginibacter sp.]